MTNVSVDLWDLGAYNKFYLWGKFPQYSQVPWEKIMPELSAVGIDLGTTYSSVAIVNEKGTAELVPNVDSERLTPSAVFFDDKVTIVGQDAKDALSKYPDQVVMFVKRQMGNPNWYYMHEGQKYTPDRKSVV